MLPVGIHTGTMPTTAFPVRVLSLFGVCAPGHPPARWRAGKGAWRITTAGGEVTVRSTGSTVTVTGGGRGISLDLDAGSGHLQG